MIPKANTVALIVSPASETVGSDVSTALGFTIARALVAVILINIAGHTRDSKPYYDSK